MNIKVNIRLMIILIIIIVINNTAQNNSQINFDSLVQKSDAVILEDKIIIEVYDDQSAFYKVSGKILIKNKTAENYCEVTLTESHFKEIEDINARLTNLNGEVIKELDSDEIQEAEFSMDAFYSGNNHKHFELTHNTYPYIIEIEYDVKISTLLYWPDWRPQSKIPTLNSEYKLVVNSDTKFRYYNKGIDVEPTIAEGVPSSTYLWKLKNIPSLLDEDYLPPEDELQMYISFVPAKFITDDYKGSTGSWDEYANWYRDMTNGRYALPENAKKEIIDLTKGVTDVKEKINILYKYLQKKNRYVAIEMGLAGWQPQSAEQVFNNRYGDCKDLSTFMVAALAVVDVKSYPALACTRSNGVVNPDYPSNQFDHCIVCVPLEKDTIWLECTSTYDDMGELGYNTENIYTLVVDENNGTLIKTPIKKSFQNKWISNIEASLSLGDLIFNTKITVEGNQKDYLRGNLASSNSKDDVSFLTSLLDENYSNLNIKMYNVSDQSVEGMDYTVTLEGTYKKFLPSEGARIFINPAIFKRKSADDLPKEDVSKRKYPVYFAYPYLNIDTVHINVPRNYTVEAKPPDQTVDNELISYTTKYDVVNNKLFFVRSYELKKNYIPLKDYPLFYETFKKIIEFDKAKFVLKKN